MKNSVLLGKRAQLIRSKNAGLFWITFGIVFENDEDFERVISAKVFTKEWIYGTYKIRQDTLIFIEIPAARAIKFPFPRPQIQGDHGETDLYSGQQYAPLLDLQIS
jgi:hypothetical protein